MFLGYCLICLTVGLGLLRWWFYRGSTNGGTADPNYPPGPIRIPLLGHMPFLAVNPHQVLKHLGKRYGSVYSIFLGTYRVVVLNDYAAIKEAFKDDVFCGRPDLKMLQVRNRAVRKGLVCSEGREWAEQRKFTMRHLKDLGFGKTSMESLIQQEIDELVDTIRNSLGTPINLQTKFNMVVLNALWTITSGERYKHEDTNLLKLIENTGADLSETQYTGPLLFLPWLMNLLPHLTRWHDFVQSIDSVHGFLNGIIQNHKATIDYSNLRDFIDAYLIEIKKTTDPSSSFYGEVGEHSLLVVLLDLFMAGADTQSTTLAWAFVYMLSYPDEQVKVQGEIDSVLGTNRPGFEHRKLMAYTEATLMEVLRMSSLVPLGLFHSTTGTTKFRSYDIPKDTVVMANLYNVLNDSEYWGDPETFRPDRFLDQNGQLIKHALFLPFSTGKRSCPGENLARDQLFLIFVRLLQEFTFRPVSSNQLPSTKPRVGVILSPVPYETVVSTRK